MTSRELAVSVAVVVAIWLPLCLLTRVGAKARGAGATLAVLEGVFFPATWLVWYVKDQ